MMNWEIRGVRIPVCILLIIFAWASWVDINGLWVELPILVNRLPEGWNLPAYFVVIIQLANIGPVVYGVLNRIIKPKDSKLQTITIYSIIVVGATSMFLLAFLWDRTSYIGDVEHSTALLVLVYFLSFVDCTSSVTFLPFMAKFSASYMTAYYIGEGMSGLVPTVIAFIQGAGEYKCLNKTVNGSWSYQPEYHPLVFPVRDFFITLFVMLLMSIVSFSLLKYLPYCKAVQSSTNKDEQYSSSEEESSQETKSTDDSIKSENEKSACSTLPMIEQAQPISIVTKEFVLLLAITVIINGLANGVLPSVQTYSVLPYGQLYYSLAVKLSQLANPLACFLTFFLAPRSTTSIITLTLVSLSCSIYILVIASFSPHPPVYTTFAGIIMVLVWILVTAVTSYLRVLIANIMLEKGAEALFWTGVFTQIGSFIGAIITFLCVTVFKLLTDAPPCVII